MAVTLKKAAPQRPHVCIAFPAYTGTVHMSMMRSVIADIMQMAQRGIVVSIADECGNALIGDCRSKIVAGFLENPAFTHLIMIDWDVSWATGALVRLVEHTLKNKDVDLVCAMYPQRSDPLTFNFRSEMNLGQGLEIDKDSGLLWKGIWGVPFGIVCMTRNLIEKMVAAHPELEFMVERGKDLDGSVKPRMKAWALFDPYWVAATKSKLGEDYAFCQRWLDLGGKVCIDPYILTGHTGNKTFMGELGDWFEEQSDRSTVAVPADEVAA